jgi:hypothetical protein
VKILVLTSINPVIAGSVYTRLANNFKDLKNVDFICYPFFAEITRYTKNQQYIPNFFAIIKSSFDPKVREKLFKYKDAVVIGNTYKKEDFDIVVAYNDLDEDMSDPYIEALKKDEDFQSFAKLIELDNLYSAENATIKLFSMQHLILFIQEALNDKNKFKSKTARGS